MSDPASGTQIPTTNIAMCRQTQNILADFRESLEDFLECLLDLRESLEEIRQNLEDFPVKRHGFSHFAGASHAGAAHHAPQTLGT